MLAAAAAPMPLDALPPAAAARVKESLVPGASGAFLAVGSSFVLKQNMLYGLLERFSEGETLRVAVVPKGSGKWPNAKLVTIDGEAVGYVPDDLAPFVDHEQPLSLAWYSPAENGGGIRCVVAVTNRAAAAAAATSPPPPPPPPPPTTTTTPGCRSHPRSPRSYSCALAHHAADAAPRYTIRVDFVTVAARPLVAA